jgi:ADP-heptose:LPS heptosyltransferase
MSRATILLRHRFALGDSVLLTALCRDIHLAYPGQYDVLLDVHYREVFDRNPYCRVATPAEMQRQAGTTRVEVFYRDGIKAAGRGNRVHMLAWYHHDFSQKTGLAVTPRFAKAALHLDPDELAPLVPGPYWLVVAGGKNDATVKAWPAARWQQLVDRLRADGVTVVQGGAKMTGHFQPNLTGVVDMVNRTPSARQFFNLVANAQGVICGITGAMHAAAAFDRPCVVVAGGREEPWWEGYTNEYGAFGQQCAPVAVPHRFLHTVGRLECCQAKGCWKHRTVAANDHSKWDDPERRCRLPVLRHGEPPTPKCMDMISVDEVEQAVMSYDPKLQLVHDMDALNLKAITDAMPKPFLKSVDPAATDVGRPRIIDIPGFDRPYLPVKGATDTYPAVAKVELAPAFVGKYEIASDVTNARGVPVRDMPAAHVHEPAAPPLIDHPTVGGKYTVFVLTYGDHADLAKRCLDSIFETAPASRLDVRVGCNAVTDATRRYLATLPLTKVYDRPANPGKYVVMREMLYDPGSPVRTPYVIWFDDDTKVVDPLWLTHLTDAIVANHPHGVRIFGTPFSHDTMMYARNGHDPLTWFRTATWWRDRHLRVRGRETEAPNGSTIQFAVGWFWAAAYAALVQADVPDRRLRHNGGDVTITEQLHQHGFKLKAFNPQKTLVWTPSREHGGRRGRSEAFPWAS